MDNFISVHQVTIVIVIVICGYGGHCRSRAPALAFTPKANLSIASL